MNGRKLTAFVVLAAVFGMTIATPARGHCSPQGRQIEFTASVAATLALTGDTAADQDRVPEGLSASDGSGIRAADEAKGYAAFAVEGGYQARNPGQAWRTRFDGRGSVTTPDSGGWSIDLSTEY